MEEKERKLWFKRKWYGWGWYPASWEGWVVTAVFAALVIFFASAVDEGSTTREVLLLFFLPTVVLVSLFIRITCVRGEKPRWQWGKPKKEEDESQLSE